MVRWGYRHALGSNGTAFAFLEQLETTRHNGAATRNVRLAAIRSFFRFLQHREPVATAEAAVQVSRLARRRLERAPDKAEGVVERLAPSRSTSSATAVEPRPRRAFTVKPWRKRSPDFASAGFWTTSSSGVVNSASTRVSHSVKSFAESRRLDTTLAETRGKVAGANGAAAKLGIPPSTLESKIKQWRITKHKFTGAS